MNKSVSQSVSQSVYHQQQSQARKVQVNCPPSGGLVFVTESGCYSQIRWMVDNKMLVTFTRVVTHLSSTQHSLAKTFPNDLLKRHY